MSDVSVCGKCSWSGGRSSRTTHVTHVMPLPHKPLQTPTTTQPSNGVTTPTPIQSGMVKNCNKFHFVQSGETCPVIQSKYKVTLANLVKWSKFMLKTSTLLSIRELTLAFFLDPAIKADCTGMWGSTYLCVGVIP